MMRLAGTVNYKTGAYARIVEADLRCRPTGSRSSSATCPTRSRRRPRRARAGRERPRGPVQADRAARVLRRAWPASPCPRRGLVSLPGAGARGPPPVLQRRRRRPASGWCCHAGTCGARGAIYDLASVLDGGPWGRELRGEAFTRARARVREAFGDLR